MALPAIKFCFKSFCKDLYNKVIGIKSDSGTAISYINQIGRTKSARSNDIAREIWNWVLEKGIWINVNHFPGKTQRQTRCLVHLQTKPNGCSLMKYLKRSVTYGELHTDLLVNRLNHKVAEYASWKPDPEFSFSKVFSKNWKEFAFIYCLPPFSLTWKTLSKIRK